jgi:hypothetical protein
VRLDSRLLVNSIRLLDKRRRARQHVTRLLAWTIRSLSALPAGVYYLQVTTARQSVDATW